MAALTQSQKDQIEMILGYASAPNILTTELDDDYNDAVSDRVAAILTQLATIDTQLQDARTDSMAMAVGNLKLSYSQHVAHLKSEGSRHLKELSNLVGVAIVFDKYKQKRSQVSYW